MNCSAGGRILIANRFLVEAFPDEALRLGWERQVIAGLERDPAKGTVAAILRLGPGGLGDHHHRPELVVVEVVDPRGRDPKISGITPLECPIKCQGAE